MLTNFDTFSIEELTKMRFLIEKTLYRKLENYANGFSQLDTDYDDTIYNDCDPTPLINSVEKLDEPLQGERYSPLTDDEYYAEHGDCRECPIKTLKELDDELDMIQNEIVFFKEKVVLVSPSLRSPSPSPTFANASSPSHTFANASSPSLLSDTCQYCDTPVFKKIYKDGSDSFCSKKHRTKYANNGDCKRYPKVSKEMLDIQLNDIYEKSFL